MSKKKAFIGSTMTLKDFHGGSIPSHLPLPSVPGLILRPSDRSGFDRQIPTTRGNHMGRSDHRSRPGSSGITRNCDEKASFLSHHTHIGRNFDEDERKPLDGVPTPRRTVSDETIPVPPSRPELKSDSVSAGRFSDRQVSSPVSHSPSAPTSRDPARFTGATPVGVNSQSSSGNNGQAVAGSCPNAWGMKKEVVGVCERVPSSAWSGPNAVSRFAQASALEKVSTGRWQSNHPIHHQPDVEVIRFSEMESEFLSKDSNRHNGIDLVNERGDYYVMQLRHAERGWIGQDGIQIDGKKLPDYERAKPPMYSNAKERNRPFYPDGVCPTTTEGKCSQSELQPLVPSEGSDRPKLKLPSRSNPLETLEVWNQLSWIISRYCAGYSGDTFLKLCGLIAINGYDLVEFRGTNSPPTLVMQKL
ncbi:hypothetical protein HHK36_002058 [Tetracentron sinense]|uniref:Uncharacterized protein n=1 Tax=Tetracentron sinense TaxID=13715 RepID=A0A834ZTT5_TETSI|nr:hypothetical protein HHK36_002058 [Tetracentron sinense]